MEPKQLPLRNKLELSIEIYVNLSSYPWQNFLLNWFPHLAKVKCLYFSDFLGIFQVPPNFSGFLLRNDQILDPFLNWIKTLYIFQGTVGTPWLIKKETHFICG